MDALEMLKYVGAGEARWVGYRGGLSGWWWV